MQSAIIYHSDRDYASIRDSYGDYDINGCGMVVVIELGLEQCEYAREGGYILVCMKRFSIVLQIWDVQYSKRWLHTKIYVVWRLLEHS